jgi:hypothetical protein
MVPLDRLARSALRIRSAVDRRDRAHRAGGGWESGPRHVPGEGVRRWAGGPGGPRAGARGVERTPGGRGRPARRRRPGGVHAEPAGALRGPALRARRRGRGRRVRLGHGGRSPWADDDERPAPGRRITRQGLRRRSVGGIPAGGAAAERRAGGVQRGHRRRRPHPGRVPAVLDGAEHVRRSGVDRGGLVRLARRGRRIGRDLRALGGGTARRGARGVRGRPGRRRGGRAGRAVVHRVRSPSPGPLACRAPDHARVPDCRAVVPSVARPRGLDVGVRALGRRAGRRLAHVQRVVLGLRPRSRGVRVRGHGGRALRASGDRVAVAPPGRRHRTPELDPA